jgi:hypothetical protein
MVEVNRGTYGGEVDVMPCAEDAFRGDVSFALNAAYTDFTLYPATIDCM